MVRYLDTTIKKAIEKQRKGKQDKKTLEKLERINFVNNYIQKSGAENIVKGGLLKNKIPTKKGKSLENYDVNAFMKANKGWF